MSEYTEQPGGGEGGGGRESDQRRHVWDKPENVKLLFSVFYALCVILVVLDPLLGLVIDRHRDHAWESWPAFYPIYGFFGIVVLVLIAKLMRRVLMRPEDYYDSSSRDAGSRDG